MFSFHKERAEPVLDTNLTFEPTGAAVAENPANHAGKNIGYRIAYIEVHKSSVAIW
jgi:hypothetical protein